MLYCAMSILKCLLAGAGACVIAFSTTDRESFDDVPKWKRKVEAECGRLPMVLIQNKIDLIDQAVMTKYAANMICVPYLILSFLAGRNRRKWHQI